MSQSLNSVQEPASEQTVTPLVMIVDDNQDNVDLIAIQMHRLKFRTVKANSGQAALAMLEQQKIQPDLLLLDVMMPGIDGYEVTRRIRADNTLPYYLPIVLLTASTNDRMRLQGLEAGADDFLQKPIKWSELLERVHSLLRLKQLSDQLRRKTEESRRLNEALRASMVEISQEIAEVATPRLRNKLD